MIHPIRLSRITPDYIVLSPPTKTDNSSLSAPYANKRYYLAQTQNGQSLFFTTVRAFGSVDVFLSANDPYPPATHAASILRASEAVLSNPPIAIHPDQLDYPIPVSNLYLVAFSSSAAQYTLTFTSFPHMLPILPNNDLSGTVRFPTFGVLTGQFVGWARAYYRIEPQSLSVSASHGMFLLWIVTFASERFVFEGELLYRATAALIDCFHQVSLLWIIALVVQSIFEPIISHRATTAIGLKVQPR